MKTLWFLVGMNRDQERLGMLSIEHDLSRDDALEASRKRAIEEGFPDYEAFNMLDPNIGWVIEEWFTKVGGMSLEQAQKAIQKMAALIKGDDDFDNEYGFAFSRN